MQSAMNLRVRGVVAAAVLAAASVGALLPAAAADACTSGNLCVYPDHNYGGPRHEIRSSESTWRYEFPGVFNKDSSWYNKGTSGYSVRIYDEESYGGWSRCYNQNTGERFSYATDDDGESNFWVYRC